MARTRSRQPAAAPPREVVYRRAPNAPITDDEAVEIGEILDSLRDENGLIHPEDVVEAAMARPRSAMHRQFTWDDGEAAKRHRLSEARRLIGYVHIEIISEEDDDATSRAFHRVRIDTDSDRNVGYSTAGTVFSREELARQVLDRAFQELAKWRAVYGQYRELAGICSAIDEAEEARRARPRTTRRRRSDR